MNNHVAILKAAKAKIEKPEHWTIHAMARDVHGVAVQPKSPAAVCFCTLGALEAVGGDYSNNIVFASFTFLSKAIRGYNIADYNDSHSYEEVLAMFDKAIQLAEGDVQQ